MTTSPISIVLKNGEEVTAAPKLDKLSLVIRTVASVNSLVSIACLVIGKHDLNIPKETFLALSVPYWLAPSCLLLLVIVGLRFLLRRERAKGFVLIDACFVAVALILFVALALTMAGM